MTKPNCTDTILLTSQIAEPIPSGRTLWAYAVRRFVALVGSGIRLAELWAERSRQRRDLAALSNRMLHDIGISRADVDGEVAKPFWRG